MPAELPAKELNAFDPGARDCFQIRRDSLCRHIAADEMEPGLRTEFPGGFTKCNGILVAENSMQHQRVGNGRRRPAYGDGDDTNAIARRAMLCSHSLLKVLSL